MVTPTPTDNERPYGVALEYTGDTSLNSGSSNLSITTNIRLDTSSFEYGGGSFPVAGGGVFFNHTNDSFMDNSIFAGVALTNAVNPLYGGTYFEQDTLVLSNAFGEIFGYQPINTSLSNAETYTLDLAVENGWAHLELWDENQQNEITSLSYELSESMLTYGSVGLFSFGETTFDNFSLLGENDIVLEPTPEPKTYLTWNEDISLDNIDFSKTVDVGHLEFGNDFDPSRDTVVITHGLQRTSESDAISTLPEWIDDMGVSLIDREENLNVLYWNWQETAASPLIPGGAIAGTQAQDNFPNESAALAIALENVLGDDYLSSVQLIGHSLGSGLMARTAQYIQDKVDLNRLTLLDGPVQGIVDGDVHLDRLLGAIDETIYIENYVSAYGRGYSTEEQENIDNIFIYNNAFSNGSVSGHFDSHEWYTATINDSDLDIGYGQPIVCDGINNYYQDYNNDYSLIDNSYDWYQGLPLQLPGVINVPLQEINYYLDTVSLVQDGSYYSDVKFQDIVYGDHWFSPDQIVLSQEDLEFYAIGTAWEEGNILYGETASPVHIVTDLTIPIETDFLSFMFKIDSWNSGDVFKLFWDDNLLFSSETSIYSLGTWYNFTDINISDWAGLDGSLIFSLITAEDGLHSIFALKDIALYSLVDPVPTPEPGTFLLLGAGLAGLAFYRRKRK